MKLEKNYFKVNVVKMSCDWIFIFNKKTFIALYQFLWCFLRFYWYLRILINFNLFWHVDFFVFFIITAIIFMLQMILIKFPIFTSWQIWIFSYSAPVFSRILTSILIFYVKFNSEHVFPISTCIIKYLYDCIFFSFECPIVKILVCHQSCIFFIRMFENTSNQIGFIHEILLESRCTKILRSWLFWGENHNFDQLINVEISYWLVTCFF